MQTQPAELPTPSLQALKQRAHQLLESQRSLQQQNQALAAESLSFESERDQLATQLQELSSERDALQAERDSLTAHLQELTAQRDSIQQQWETLQTTVEDLQGQHHDSIHVERDKLVRESKVERSECQTLQPDILDETKGHEGKALIAKSKQVFVFVHAAKSGGSSFWQSLVKACQNYPDIAIADARHASIERFGDVNHQRDASVQLLQEFTGLRKRKLLLHYHADEPELHQAIPLTIAVTYILLIRNEGDRLKSAYKWYLQTELLVSSASSQEDVMSFFSTFLAKGYHELMPAILGGLEDPSRWTTLENPAKVAMLSIDDYNNPAESDAVQSIVKLLVCDTPEPFVFSGTVTSNHSIIANLPGLSNDEFWDQIYAQARREVGFLRSLRPINALAGN